MVEDSDNRELNKEEAERKRLHDEMMASIRAQNEKSLKLREEAKSQTETVSVKSSLKDNILVIIYTLSILSVTLFLPAYFINSIFSINLYVPASIILIVFSIIMIFGMLLGSSGSSTVIPPQNPHMKCPHCATIGQINTKKVDLTKGISGGKAVAGLLTGGLSILAVGISREETQTEARCGKCNNVWHF